MKIFILFLLLAFSTSAFSKASIRCKYKEGKQTVFKLTGKLDEDGGKLKMKGEYVTGYPKVQKVKFYRTQRANEDKFEYAKYSIKSPQQYEKNEFITPFYRLSIPKDILNGKKKLKNFSAYFGYHKSESADGTNLEELPPLKCRVRLL
jgi:hypothetical protein